jgi:hypothetical protein
VSDDSSDYELEIEGLSLVCSACGRHYWITPVGEFRHLSDPLPGIEQCAHVGMKFQVVIGEQGYLRFKQIR